MFKNLRLKKFIIIKNIDNKKRAYQGSFFIKALSHASRQSP